MPPQQLPSVSYPPFGPKTVPSTLQPPTPACSAQPPHSRIITAVNWQPEIFLSDAERNIAESDWRKAKGGASSPRLLVNLSASEPKRRWPDDKFVEVLRRARAIAPRIRIIVIGLPAEWESVKATAHAVNALAVPTPRLRDALALVGTSDMVFTPDTSISHAASAFEKPAVVLLKRDHYPYAPYNIPGENIFWDGPSIASLSVDEVGNAVLRLVLSGSQNSVHH